MAQIKALSILVGCAALALTLSACPGSGSGSKAGKAPMKLTGDYRKTAKPSKPISAEFQAKFLATVRADSAFLPDTSVIFDDGDYEARQKSRAELSEEGQKNLAKIKAECTINPEVEHSPEIDQPQVNVTYTSSSEKSITGSNCPVSYSEKSRTDFMFTSIDYNTGVVNGGGDFNQDIKGLVTSSEWAKRPGTGVELNLNAKAHMVFEGVKFDSAGIVSGTSYATAQFKGDGFYQEGPKFKITGKMEYLKRDQRDDRQVQFAMHFDEGDLVFTIIQIDGVVEVYINGVESNIDEVNKTFRMNIGDFLKD